MIVSKDGDSLRFLGNSLQCSVTHRVSKFFLVFKWNILYFNPSTLPVVLSFDTTVWFCFLAILPQDRNMGKIIPEPPLLQVKPSFLSLSSYDSCSSPLTISVAVCWTHFSKSMSVFAWKVQYWTQYSDVCSQHWTEGKGHSFNLLFPVQPRKLLLFLIIEDTLPAYVQCFVYQDLQVFLAKLFSSLSWCLELFLPRVRTWHFYFLNFMVPVGPNFQLVKPPLSGSQTVLCISLAGSLLVLQPVQLSRSLMKTENSTGPIVGPEVYH